MKGIPGRMSAGRTARAAGALLVLLLALCLSGCGPRQGAKVVDAAGWAQFRAVVDGPARGQGLTDPELPDLDDGRKRGTYGELMFERISPDFLFEETAHEVYMGRSFRATLTPMSKMHLDADGDGFWISHPTQKLSMRLLAVVDWNVDGERDWLMRCTVETYRNGRERRYWLIAPEPKPGVETEAAILAVADGRDERPAVTLRDVSDYGREEPSAEILETKAGGDPITAPPDGERPDDGVKERNL